MLVGEQQVAARQVHISWRAATFDDVLVLVGDRLGAHLAPLAGRLRRAGWLVADPGTARRRRLRRSHHITPVASASTATDSTPSRSSSGSGSRCVAASDRAVDGRTGVHDVEVRPAARAAQHRLAPIGRPARGADRARHRVAAAARSGRERRTGRRRPGRPGSPSRRPRIRRPHPAPGRRRRERAARPWRTSWRVWMRLNSDSTGINPDDAVRVLLAATRPRSR